MIDRDEAEQVLAEHLSMETTVGNRLGPIRRVFLDDYTGWPSFATIDSAAEPGRESFVALHQADLEEDRVVVPYPLDKITGAPTVDAADSLTTHQEDDLFDYYGVPIDGAVPAVSHLGNALEPQPDGNVSETSPTPSGSPRTAARVFGDGTDPT